MSYCVNCGVELDATASFCPLCHTPVLNPNQPVDEHSPQPFPTERGEVAPVSKRELALLLTAMLASVSVCCGLLNLFLPTDRTWSLYVIGAALMLWLWLVPPLLLRGMPLVLRLAVDAAAVGVYVFLIAVRSNGMGWYRGAGPPHHPVGRSVPALPGTGAGRRAALHPDHRHAAHRHGGGLSWVRVGALCGPIFSHDPGSRAGLW